MCVTVSPLDLWDDSTCMAKNLHRKKRAEKSTRKTGMSRITVSWL